MKTQYLCFPLNTKPTTTTNTTTSSSSTTNARASPPGSTSILDRFRMAVFRLIMATALSKANNNSSSSSSSSRLSTNNHDYYRNNSSSNNNHGHESVRRSCYLYDPYHNEALADCIEFIKKKSALSSPSDHIRLHHDHDHDDNVTTRGSTVSSDVDVVIPLPVM